MATKSKTVLVCDMRHRGDVEAVGTIEIVIDGRRCKLDLCADHRAEARRDLGSWFNAGHDDSPTPRAKRASAATARAKSAKVRDWTEANGYELPGRGRIPSHVHVAYAETHRG